MSEGMRRMRKLPLKENKFRRTKGILTFQTKFSNRISTSSSLLPITAKKKTLSDINRRKVKNPFTTFQ